MEHFLNKRFPFQGFVNTQNRRIWTTENPFALAQVLFLSVKVTVWCTLTASFTPEPLFLEKLGPTGAVTCIVNDKRYESLLCHQVIPVFQQHARLGRITFMQDGTSPYVAKPVIQLLERQFGNDRIISHHFSRSWSLRSIDLNPCNFWIIIKCCIQWPDCKFN